MSYKFKSQVVIWPGETANWYFAYVPQKMALTLSKRYDKMHRGWRSLPVEAKVGQTSWCTSIFYDKRSNTYILPIKAQVRKKEGIYDKDSINLTLKIVL